MGYCILRFCSYCLGYFFPMSGSGIDSYICFIQHGYVRSETKWIRCFMKQLYFQWLKAITYCYRALHLRCLRGNGVILATPPIILIQGCVNTLTANDEYFCHNRENLPLPIQMRLFKKPRTFCCFFIAFLKSKLNFEVFFLKKSLIV